MASRDATSGSDWVLRRPLQIESLRQELPESEDNDKLLRRLQHNRENLDAVVYALSSRKLAPDRRQHLLTILERHQRALEECLAELGMPHRLQPMPPLFYFNQLDPPARAHLAAILSVPEEQPYYAVLDVKAEEYLLQQEAFESLTARHGYSERPSLSRSTKKAVLVLTLSGSLIQISEPVAAHGARRYFYQNIYGNAHPPEGILVLDRDIQVGHRIRSVELTTSPVRLLRVINRRMSWKDQSQAFERISRTLSSLVSRSTSHLAAAGYELGRSPNHTGVIRRANLEAAERVLRQEYGEAFGLYEQLRGRFTSESGEDGRRVEAELLTICHFLQTGARELGFDARALEEIVEFTTEGEHIYRVDPSHVGTVTMIPRGTGPEVQFVDVSVGRQHVTRFAPLALIGRDGGLVEVTLPVLSIRRK
jgi:hypothetical protein